MRIRLNTDLAVAALGIAFAAVMWFGSELPGRLSILFPRAVLIIMCVLCVLLALKGFWRPSAREVVIEGNPARLVAMIAVLLVWWAGIRTLGFIVSTSLVFLAVTSYLAHIQGDLTLSNLMKWIPIIAVLVGGFYLVFSYVLNVKPPAGLFI
jgi:uncharacterized BrkB/YihY/UPF0761 family membrane protein